MLISVQFRTCCHNKFSQYLKTSYFLCIGDLPAYMNVCVPCVCWVRTQTRGGYQMVVSHRGVLGFTQMERCAGIHR